MRSHSICNRYIALYNPYAYKQYGIISPQDESSLTFEKELLTMFNHALVTWQVMWTQYGLLRTEVLQVLTGKFL
jgi:hypothetical protein